MQWLPCASLDALHLGDTVRAAIRHWMQAQGILEVCTPVLSFAANTDVAVEPLSLAATKTAPIRYLHTSPEFAMKRLLAAYPQSDIYQIATVFRAEEQGRFHNTQFSMLEWYRTGMDHRELMLDAASMLQFVYTALGLDFPGITYCSYCEAVRARLGFWPHELQPMQLRSYFEQQARSFPDGLDDDINACLDLFMDEFVIPDFPTQRYTVVTDYPAAQAALAQVSVNEQGLDVAERFEIYFGQLELANGFHELRDAEEQLQRFEQDLASRRKRNIPLLPIDENLLAALESGLPECSGIAIGLERLLMAVGRYEHINQVMCFDDARA